MSVSLSVYVVYGAKPKRLAIDISLPSMSGCGFYLYASRLAIASCPRIHCQRTPQHVFFLPTRPSVAPPSMSVVERIKLDGQPNLSI